MRFQQQVFAALYPETAFFHSGKWDWGDRCEVAPRYLMSQAGELRTGVLRISALAPLQLRMGPAFCIQAVVFAIQTMVLGAQARHWGDSQGEIKAF